MRIAMPRGDIKWQRFLVNTPAGKATELDFTSIYFTVKKRSTDRSFLFQKSLKRGEIYRIGLGDYQFKIEPKDTNKLPIGDYKFDIQITYKNLLKESFVGDFVLKEEVTYYENEDEEEYETDYSLPQTSESSAVILEIPDYHILELETPIDITETTDYNAMSNKPSINNVVLEGNLTLEDLGIPDVCAREPLTEQELDEIVDQ